MITENQSETSIFKYKVNFDQVKETYEKYITDDVLKNTGLTVGIFAVVVVSQLILHEFVQIVDSIPVFNSLMQVIGTCVTAKFAIDNLTTKEKRQNLFEKVSNKYDEFVG